MLTSLYPLTISCLTDMHTPPPPISLDIPGSSSSVIIIYQLEDKLKAHSRYLQFITDIGLLDKVRG